MPEGAIPPSKGTQCPLPPPRWTGPLLQHKPLRGRGGRAQALKTALTHTARAAQGVLCGCWPEVLWSTCSLLCQSTHGLHALNAIGQPLCMCLLHATQAKGQVTESSAGPSTTQDRSVTGIQGPVWKQWSVTHTTLHEDSLLAVP